MDLVFGYVWCLLAASLAGGLTLAISLVDVPLWLDVMVWGAAVPVYLLLGVIYLGGMYHGFGKIFAASADDGSAKDA